MWQYYIELFTEHNYGWLVEGEETEDTFPICKDYNVAVSFPSPDKLNEWVKENTSLKVENGDYGITGIYYPDRVV